MNDFILQITWNVRPEIFADYSVRWYGLLFALGFLGAYEYERVMFRFEKTKESWLDSAILYIFVGTLVGARLGHVFFYEPAKFLADPISIIKIWNGGLASHGALIGIILMLFWWSNKVSKRSVLWVLDRAVIGTALAAIFIRTGNLMNSEIIGLPTDLPWGFVFERLGPDEVPRHPTQIYEALAYLGTFLFLSWLYFKRDAGKKLGMLLGVFFVAIFGARFFIEFLKENQVAFEANIPLNMGQWLSIPIVLIGIYLIYRGATGPQHGYPENRHEDEEKAEQQKVANAPKPKRKKLGKSTKGKVKPRR